MLDSRDILHNLGDASGFVVAYSGGLDSTVLLTLLADQRAALNAPLRAVHVNHGLHPDADAWLAHCQAVCSRLGVPLQCESVLVAAGSSPEARARDARYGVFSRVLAEGEVLLTAHHLDDQAETLLLRLLRGAGVTGLAGMPPNRRLGRGWLRRPLLGVSREAILAWARAHGLGWIDDPSNAEMLADRNFLRHGVIPLLESRWPGTPARLAGAAADAAEARDLLQVLAELDAAGTAAGPWLDVNALHSLDAARQRNVLRHWLSRHGLQPPGRRRLQAGLSMLLQAGPDRQPELRWPGGRIRRYRRRLFADPGVNPPPPPPRPWHGESRLSFAAGTLSCAPVGAGMTQGPGPGMTHWLDPALAQGRGLELRFGLGNPRCRPLGRPSRPLKALFQEAGIPPWLRPLWPVLLAGEDIAAVPSICLCQGFESEPGKAGLLLAWIPWQQVY